MVWPCQPPSTGGELAIASWAGGADSVGRGQHKERRIMILLLLMEVTMRKLFNRIPLPPGQLILRLSLTHHLLQHRRQASWRHPYQCLKHHQHRFSSMWPLFPLVMEQIPVPQQRHRRLNPQVTSSAMTSSLPLPVPVFPPKSPETRTTTTQPPPRMPLVSPTFTYPSNTTDTVCTDDRETGEYPPGEESSCWRATTKPSISYSDYTVMVIVKSTSTTTVSNTAVVQAAATAGNSSVAVTMTFLSSLTDTAETTISESIMNSTSTMKIDPTVVYTPIESSDLSIQSSDSTSILSTTQPELTMTSETMSPTTTVTDSILTDLSPTTTDPSQETIWGTIITYVDKTATITANQSTSTITEIASTTDTAESTSTTTVWTISTIISDVNVKLRQWILVTRRAE